MKRLVISLLLFLFIHLVSSLNVRADSSGYSAKKVFIVRNEKIIVIHRHDWSHSSSQKRNEMFLGDQNPFTDENNYSWLECVDVYTNRVLFTRPVPALTYLYVSPDLRYIVGLSNIKLDNPVQFVVFNTLGDLQYFISVSPIESKLNREEYIIFEKKFPKDAIKLKNLRRIQEIGDLVFINLGTMPPLSRKAWLYLFKWNVRSHLSKNFSESVTNFIDWYKEPDPEIQLKYENEKLAAVSLLDPAGERFEIKIK